MLYLSSTGDSWVATADDCCVAEAAPMLNVVTDATLSASTALAPMNFFP